MSFIWILAILGFKSFLFAGCRSESEMNSLVNGKWSIYYEFLKTASAMEEKSECINHTKTIFRAINTGEVWALKALDASGSVSSSFIYQQNFWHGSKLACILLHSVKSAWMSSEYNFKVVNEKSPFKMKYFTVFANYSTMNQIPRFSYAYVPFQLGVCAPESCSKDQVLNIINPVLKGGQLPFQQLYNVTFELLTIRTENLMNFFEREYILLCCLLAFVALVLLMNIIGVHNETLWGRFVSCFNLRRNFHALMSTTRPKGGIDCLDGIRSITCIWTMIVHMYYFSSFAYENAAEAMYIAKDFGFQLILLAGIFFEAFFVISAFLLTYKLLSSEEWKNVIISNGPIKNAMFYIIFWLNRYVRLTPGLLFTVALVRLTAVYMEEATQLYYTGTKDNNCLTNSWWRNLLYIQGFYPVGEMCVFWSWYLSCDMFYFSIALLVLFVYIKSPLTGKVCFILLLICANVYSFILYWWERFDFGFDKLQGTMEKLYVAPLARANSYFAGIIGGYLLYSMKDVPFKIKQWVKLSWYALEVVTVVVFYLLLSFFTEIPSIISQLMGTTGRFILGIVIAGAIVIINSESSGIMKSLLCSRFFVHFSKLTFMIYLLNPVIIYAYRAAGDSSVRVNTSNIFVEGAGIVVISYFAALIVSLFFERPYSRLFSEFVLKPKKNH